MSEQMAIYILEDQIIQAKALEALVTNILHSRNIYNETIHLFSRSDELLQVAHQDAQLNIFFLDIQMNNHIQAGFEVAKEIRKTDSESLIVFISTHTELVLTSYKYMVSALQFIQKNVDFLDFQKEVETCVDAYIQQKENIKTKSEYIIINLKASSIKMDINDIYFFQTEYDHRVSMVGKNFKREFYGTLSKIEQLHPDLIRVHQSIIINKKYATKLNYKTHLLTMRDGTEVPVSRRYYTQVKALFLT